MIYYCWLLLLLLATRHSVADVSKLYESSNGFIYDLPPISDLNLQPLDATIDEKTQWAFGQPPKILNSYKQFEIAPAVGAAVSLQKQLSKRKPRFYEHSSYYEDLAERYDNDSDYEDYELPATSSEKSGYNYEVPLKPFFIG